ncbi:hypothetical protein ACFSYH_03260 [Populibacterium corticicola]|uniref:Uncharacterized protein n=1 Tax=Populibacterium corticicola TaxID=1812826 RepID=A0ABW5XCH4_9MICO
MARNLYDPENHTKAYWTLGMSAVVVIAYMIHGFLRADTEILIRLRTPGLLVENFPQLAEDSPATVPAKTWDAIQSSGFPIPEGLASFSTGYGLAALMVIAALVVYFMQGDRHWRTERLSVRYIPRIIVILSGVLPGIVVYLAQRVSFAPWQESGINSWEHYSVFWHWKMLALLLLSVVGGLSCVHVYTTNREIRERLARRANETTPETPAPPA